MRINFLVFACPAVGLGHWYRSIALAEYIQAAGHQVRIISDRQPPDNLLWHSVSFDDQVLWRSPLMSPADWLAIDLPDEAPDWLYDHCRANGIQTCILNGVGHQVGDRADLRIVQGLAEAQYSGVDYIILRESVFHIKAIRRPAIEWFVFGGGADKMGLTRRFPDLQRVSFSISDADWYAVQRPDDGFLVAASQCRRACVAMGMTVWELVAMGIPTYVFSLTDLHLYFALNMQEAGYINAWNGTGLPTRSKMNDFLSEPFVPAGKPIDGRACERILKLMER